jgi:hypothetical protein
MKYLAVTAAVSLLLAPTALEAQAANKASAPQMTEWNDAKFGGNPEALDFTWSGHRAFADFLMIGDRQIIGYYDANRQLTIAYRQGMGSPWRYHKLPSWVGWDSHNRVELGVDESGHVHVLANMHADPLVYFRSEQPWDVRTIVQHKGMIYDEYEQRVTYPFFMNDNQGQLIAKFRSGGSGNGIELYHRYDVKKRKWTRMHNGGPLADGEGERNGYFQGPELGPDGYFHLSWVWRETPSANTNHDLSYARSKDLEKWETSDGKPLALPLKLGASEVVDPVPVGGGILNGQHRLGFDKDLKPMISYYKYDAKGDTQIYLRRKTPGGWQQYQVSNWTGSRLELDRQGSLANAIGVSDRPRIAEDGTIRVRASRSGKVTEWRLDPATNKVLGERTITDMLPTAVQSEQAKRDMPLQIVRPKGDGTGRMAEYDWYLTWHALPPNQDIARDDIPAPSVLKLIPVAKK